MSSHGFFPEHDTAATVLTMSDTRFLSDSVVNMWLQKFHVSGSVVSLTAEHLLESCGSGRVSRGEWWKMVESVVSVLIR